MPKGPFGFPRLTNLGPMTELTRDERIKRVLEQYGSNVSITDDPVGTRFTYRVDIERDEDPLADVLPITQNIPSNLQVITERNVSGTIRPPLVSKSVVSSESELQDRIESIISVEVQNVLTPESSGGKSYRPHIEIRHQNLNTYFEALANIHDRFREEFE
jgi:hypothetical protein